MSRYKIQIETGLIGVALCLALFFWTQGRAVNTENYNCPSQSLPFTFSPVDDVLNEMNIELKTARRLLITEPNHLAFITADGVRRHYRFNHESFWKDEIPLIYGISSFHFEYRNRHGQLLTRAKRYHHEIRRVHYLMNFFPSHETDYTNHRIKLNALQQESVTQLASAE